METRVKYREMPIQVVLMIVTVGLYAIYWFYQTAMELKALTADHDAAPALWTILLFIPFGQFYSFYKYGEIYEAASDPRMDRWIIFLLWLVFSPAVWFIVQTDLNRRARPAGQAT